MKLKFKATYGMEYTTPEIISKLTVEKLKSCIMLISMRSQDKEYDQSIYDHTIIFDELTKQLKRKTKQSL